MICQVPPPPWLVMVNFVLKQHICLPDITPGEFKEGYMDVVCLCTGSKTLGCEQLPVDSINCQLQITYCQARSSSELFEWLRSLRTFKIVIWLILPVVICLSQRLSHACLSISNLYSETANGSLNQLSFI